MTIETLLTATLHAKPEQRTSTRTGRAYVTVKVRVPAADGDALYLFVTAFDAAACAALLALNAGDAVALAGTFKPTAWLDRDGAARPSGELVVSQVMSLYGLKRRRTAAAAADTVVADTDQRQPAAPKSIGPQDWPKP